MLTASAYAFPEPLSFRCCAFRNSVNTADACPLELVVPEKTLLPRSSVMETDAPLDRRTGSVFHRDGCTSSQIQYSAVWPLLPGTVMLVEVFDADPVNVVSGSGMPPGVTEVPPFQK